MKHVQKQTKSQTVLKISTFNPVKRKTSIHSVSSTLSLNVILILPFNDISITLEEEQIKLKNPNEKQWEKKII